MRVIALLILVVAAATAAVPTFSPKIVGGSVTSISNYPTIAAVLYSFNLVDYRQSCGGTILNQRAVLSAAHCYEGRTDPVRTRIRVGSSYASSGGVVHNLARIIMHPNYNSRTQNNDIAILRTSSNIVYNNNVRAARIAGTNYNLGDNQVVWAAGWGTTSNGGSPSEQLRHVQIWTVNQAVCRQRYRVVGITINDNMLCSGYLDVGGRDQCQQDSGGPLYHNGVVVGVCSFGERCGDARYPGVNARVSRYATWIQNNA